MLYRALGNTGLQISAIGLGCGMIGSSDTDYAVSLVRRARDRGVTFFDVAHGYRDAEVKLGIALKGDRQNVVISSKTTARTREGAWREINESLERLQTDYLDNHHLHCLRDQADIDERLGKGGALEAFLQAKEQGMIRHIGCTTHYGPHLLVSALKRFPFETILVPMNIVEPEPLAELIPLCESRGVGVTIMKPLATGLLPSRLALRWLLRQPIASACPGATTIEEAEANALAADGDLTPDADELASVAAAKADLQRVRCRICGECLPCPVKIPIGDTLGTDVNFNHYRTMGPDGFRNFRWSRSAIQLDLASRRPTIAAIEACTRCGDCEPRCRYGLPIVEMLQATLPAMRDMVNVYEAKLG